MEKTYIVDTHTQTLPHTQTHLRFAFYSIQNASFLSFIQIAWVRSQFQHTMYLCRAVGFYDCIPWSFSVFHGRDATVPVRRWLNILMVLNSKLTSRKVIFGSLNILATLATYELVRSHEHHHTITSFSCCFFSSLIWCSIIQVMWITGNWVQNKSGESICMVAISSYPCENYHPATGVVFQLQECCVTWYERFALHGYVLESCTNKLIPYFPV